MLDEGKYRGRVKQWGFSESKNKKSRFELNVRLASREAESGDFEEMEEPVSRTVFLYLSAPAMGMTAAAIRSLGYEEADLARLDPDHENAFDLTDVEVTVRVNHEEWEGKPKEKVELDRTFSRKLKPAALTAFDEANLAFAAAQEKEAQQGAKGDASDEDAGRRRKKRPVAAG